MIEACFLPYDDERHRAKYMEMMVEYCTWLDNEVYTHYGVRLFPDGDIQGFVDGYTSIWTAVKPPMGIIYILEVDGEAVGMGRIDTFEEGIGEVHNVWTNPEHRGRGYATRLMNHLENKAKEFGFSALRLDTAKFNIPAQRLYIKRGYSEIERYREITRNENIRLYYEEKVYMEKKL
jgi:ribosomal protein S18 acetylase RimI-like enzyme